MSSMVPGHLDMSREAQQRELSAVLEMVGAPRKRVSVLLERLGQVEGTYRGAGCKVVCMDNPTTEAGTDEVSVLCLSAP